MIYKVVLADDHYPVLEYLSASIPWDTLGLELSAVCSDGRQAWEACQLHQPDILLTDIGMPVMDGLELIRRAREANPQLQAVILSCHGEFEYARQAVKLNVTEYILKESMQIDQIIAVLTEAVSRLEAKLLSANNFLQMQKLVSQNHSAIRTRFIRMFVEQPVWDEAEWFRQAGIMGIRLLKGLPYLPVLAIPERSYELERRFGGIVNMQFVIDNVLQEFLEIDGIIQFALTERQFILFIPFPQILVRNLHEEYRNRFRHVQTMSKLHLRMEISFFYGEATSSLIELKKQIQTLLDSRTLRFYTAEGTIMKLEPFKTTHEDLFVHYSEFLQQLRDCIQQENSSLVSYTVTDIKKYISGKKYPVESVKSWLLKMVMELELKYIVMQNFVNNFNSEKYQRSIRELETLDHLMEWLEEFLNDKILMVRSMWKQNVRKEVAEAKRYVMNHIGDKVSMDEMARRLGLNPTHFSRLFKIETGLTFIEYVTKLKMEYARDLLNQTNSSIVEIAEQLGFDNTSYFIKLFRNFSGMTPAEFRKSL
ncbi:helix-turn-helix domain-containing protein [Paenibacillus sp. MMS20-IR301]|uniref:response regulator transcription factor n=1 Tax=Paenibacillus sp. MMS20-IR301 TaxID=2895946 RepID=UPI0028E672A6|nr:helix-turn-helix domain-containing protein [Paenibacillus sp. MMS20-IR301]WNS43987.1 helix-turn-helix domain-containing protein [Paenibacillus sp. MMS20-IR301]